jgi:hypothetical protein
MGTLYYGDNLDILRRYLKDETRKYGGAPPNRSGPEGRRAPSESKADEKRQREQSRHAEMTLSESLILFARGHVEARLWV